MSFEHKVVWSWRQGVCDLDRSLHEEFVYLRIIKGKMRLLSRTPLFHKPRKDSHAKKKKKLETSLPSILAPPIYFEKGSSSLPGEASFARGDQFFFLGAS